MKIKNLLWQAAVIALIVAACKKGDTGPAGSKGDTGATGATGAKGDKGDPGTANVSYSPWIRIDASKWTMNPAMDKQLVVNGTFTDTIYTFHADIPASAITQGVQDSGFVLYFVKDSASVSTHGQTFQWLPSYGGGVASVTDVNTFYNLDAYADITVGKVPLTFTWTAYDNTRGISNYPDRSQIPPNTKFFVRYIVVPGGHLTTGRLAAHDRFRNYEDAKAYFGLTD